MNKRINQLIARLDTQLPQLLRVEEIRASIKRHSFLLLFIFLSGLLAYAHDIFEFSLHMDSEIDAFKKGPHLIWIREGRWGVYFLNAILLPDPTLPVVPILIAIVGTGVGMFFFVKTMSRQRSMADYLTTMIAIGCPVLYFAFYWQSLAYALGVAFAFINIGMYCLSRWTKSGFTIATLCFCFGIGVYQAVAPVIVVIYGMYLISSLLEKRQITFKKYIIHSLIFGFALILALVLYKLITFLTLLLYRQPSSDAYLGSFVAFELSNEYFLKYFPLALQTTLSYYTGGKAYYLYELLTLKLLFYFSLMVVGYRILTSVSEVKFKILGLAVLLIILITPMFMLLMNAGEIPARTMIAVIFVLAGLVFLASAVSSNIVKTILFILTISCYINFVIINQRYALSNQLAWQADREFSVMLLDRINAVYFKLPPKERITIDALGISTKRYPLDIVGVKERYAESPVFVQREAFGASFYTWVDNEVRRQVSLFAVMGNFDFWPASRTDRRSIIGQVLSMPSWPHAGSVDVVNGVVVVKFGNYQPAQIESMCGEAAEDDNVYCQQLRRDMNHP